MSMSPSAFAKSCSAYRHELRNLGSTWLLARKRDLGWNVVGTPVMLAVAVKAGSAALVGFGLDSAIEIFASVVVIWQLKGVKRTREGWALKLIGAAFIALAIYILVQSGWVLLSCSDPAPSPAGTVWLAVTCVVMLFLAGGKQVTGRQLGNPVLVTEARITLIDAALAAVVLVGVGLNALAGWWWADPLAGLVIVYLRIEGRSSRFQVVSPARSADFPGLVFSHKLS